MLSKEWIHRRAERIRQAYVPTWCIYHSEKTSYSQKGTSPIDCGSITDYPVSGAIHSPCRAGPTLAAVPSFNWTRKPGRLEPVYFNTLSVSKFTITRRLQCGGVFYDSGTYCHQGICIVKIFYALFRTQKYRNLFKPDILEGDVWP